jgi:hypothetical protein
MHKIFGKTSDFSAGLFITKFHESHGDLPADTVPVVRTRGLAWDEGHRGKVVEPRADAKGVIDRK